MQQKLDMRGLVKAFADHDRKEREYILDTEAGTIHFVPTEYLKLAERGKLQPETLPAQSRERAEIALRYLDDIAGRYEMIPFVEPEAEADWRQEFLIERGASAYTPELEVDWLVYKREMLEDQATTWLEESGILEMDNEDDEDWDDDGGEEE